MCGIYGGIASQKYVTGNAKKVQWLLISEIKIARQKAVNSLTAFCSFLREILWRNEKILPLS